MELLLTEYRAFFERVPKLQIHIEKYELSNSDMDLLLSFANLHKLQTGRIKLHKALPSMSSTFQHMQNFKEIVFLGHEISDWSNITLPPHLENLDVSWYEHTDVTSIKLPDSLANLYWNQVGLRNGVFDKMAFSTRLRTLMLTYNNLNYINVSELPQSLETVDLSNNNLSSFKYNEAQASWPPNLRSILLHNNLINNSTLNELSEIEWPRSLENLRLDVNKFTSLENLQNLPENLKYLDLSDTSLVGFQVSNNSDEYPYFKFPESLDTLNIQGSRGMKFPEKTSEVMRRENRIQFPSNLETLNLSECNIEDLSYFLFPSSLQSLSLNGNKISSLSTYNCQSQNINWDHLHLLEELELFFNLIDNLEHWVPPKSIRKIDLRRNLIQVLTCENTPIFSEKNDQLRYLASLNFEQNEISQIDLNVRLPPYLRELNLSRNKLAEFTFTSTFATHLYLHKLDLSCNLIQQIATEPSPNCQNCSDLKELDLSKNSAPFTMTSDQFYATLEQIGLIATKRKHNIKSKHFFK